MMMMLTPTMTTIIIIKTITTRMRIIKKKRAHKTQALQYLVECAPGGSSGSGGRGCPKRSGRGSFPEYTGQPPSLTPFNLQQHE
jgi:hypothetical protein